MILNIVSVIRVNVEADLRAVLLALALVRAAVVDNLNSIKLFSNSLAILLKVLVGELLCQQNFVDTVILLLWT